MHVHLSSRVIQYEEEDTCMSYAEEDTCMCTFPPVSRVIQCNVWFFVCFNCCLLKVCFV